MVSLALRVRRNPDQAGKLTQPERENARLKRAVAELTIDKLILKDAADGEYLGFAAIRLGLSLIDSHAGGLQPSELLRSTRFFDLG